MQKSETIKQYLMSWCPIKSKVQKAIKKIKAKESRKLNRTEDKLENHKEQIRNTEHTRTREQAQEKKMKQ